ncbi:hypothetical protein FACS189442_2760 [Spirochaetia bacterium]|nr:hypothetical protein FACS189442_2760 [Spirochaetia bacterium]
MTVFHGSITLFLNGRYDVEFLESNTYRAIQDTRSLMWYENAEFIADEYYREKETETQGEAHEV